jgi:DNA-binding MarR family transcriptional regulator
VVNSVPDDTQLEQLLTQLLRAVSPVPSAERFQKAAQPEAYAVAAAGSATGAGAPADAGLATEAPAPVGADLPSVTSSEARALIELMSARGIAQGELAALLGLDKSTVSRLASGLERKGWIRRGRDEDNQRYVRLYLTATCAAAAASPERTQPESGSDRIFSPVSRNASLGIPLAAALPRGVNSRGG